MREQERGVRERVEEVETGWVCNIWGVLVREGGYNKQTNKKKKRKKESGREEVIDTQLLRY